MSARKGLLVITPEARSDIEQVLMYSEEVWGSRKAIAMSRAYTSPCVEYERFRTMAGRPMRFWEEREVRFVSTT